MQENRSKAAVKRDHALKEKAETEVNSSKPQLYLNKEPMNDLPKEFVTKLPLPKRFSKSKKKEEEKEILETFCKVEVNIPLLDAIKQVSSYANFLKELCTHKR